MANNILDETALYQYNKQLLRQVDKRIYIISKVIAKAEVLDASKKIKDLKIPVIKNHINLGKGRALKYGINYILNTCEECKVIVTADSDGQHSAKDIQKCAKMALENVDKLKKR